MSKASLSARIGLGVCSVGWRLAPLRRAPVPATPAQLAYAARAYRHLRWRRSDALDDALAALSAMQGSAERAAPALLTAVAGELVRRERARSGRPLGGLAEIVAVERLRWRIAAVLRSEQTLALDGWRAQAAALLD